MAEEHYHSRLQFIQSESHEKTVVMINNIDKFKNSTFYLKEMLTNFLACSSILS